MTSLFDIDDNPRIPSAPFSLSPRVQSGLVDDGPLPIKGSTIARPLYATEVEGDVDLTPFYVGARLLGLRKVGPQQLEIARLLLVEDEAGRPLHAEVVIEEPRRAAKTTTIWAVLLGLCATRKDFKVVVTAQTYVKARERFLEVYREIIRHNIGEFVVKRGAGDMSIEWTNGSRLWVVTPEGGAFRGDGADRIMFDEAQEHTPEQTADLLGGALALMDTRFDEDEDLTVVDARSEGQLIVTGTTGENRAGMLWDFLERGRAGQIAILEYAVPEGTPVALEVRTEDGQAAVAAGWGLDKSGQYVLNEPAILAAHPGIGTLTTLGTIRARFSTLNVAQFRREYGGQWPVNLNTRAIDPGEWQAGVLEAWPPLPARYALGFDVAPDQSTAALVAAWRDADGRAFFEVIAHDLGDAWLPKTIHGITSKASSTRVGYDNIGPNQAVANRLEREARPRPKLVNLGTRDIVAAASQTAQEIKTGNLFHPKDASLDGAAEIATRRAIGDGSWAWGRRKSGDISCLVAGTNALFVYDQDTRPATRTGIVTRRTTSTRRAA